MLKGLPLAYDRDLQEDKEPVFDSVEQLLLVLPAMAGMVATLQVRDERMSEAAATGHALATDVAEWLVRSGTAFRDAHEIAGRLVRHCDERGLRARGRSTTTTWRRSTPRLTPTSASVLSVRGALLARSTHGGTAPARVAEQLAALADAGARARGLGDR